ncbi:Intradiol ring-cleavage dioxygenase [Xylogone sp. PMI_703]|nr:Intradiol ring-cleavage dioxygenase [Xylogone sp. PMI_703]
MASFAAVDVNENTRNKWAEAPKPHIPPPVIDLTIENITENVNLVNSNVQDNPRLQYIMTKLVKAAHDFIRDVELQFDEWEMAWQYLTKVGQISTDVRHEMVLLSDILGISALVDSISYPRVPGSTESSILGPFHDEDALFFDHGKSIVADGTFGEATLVRGKILDVDGNLIVKALIDVWETDGHGVYDLEYAEKEGPDCRGKLWSNKEGEYAFVCVKPVPYPISNDGPVGALLRTMNRHWYRPAHMHFIIIHPEYNKLITALYSRDSKYVESDTVFGVKKSLIVDYVWCEDEALAKQYGVKMFLRTVGGVEKRGFWLLEFDFTLVKKGEPTPRKTHD